MKRVHSTKQLAHLFCHMTNSDLEGFRTPSKNIYFERGVLYSYGPHYPMAAKYSIGEGLGYREIILINSNKSTVTTEKHKSMVSTSRKPDQWRFWVPNVKDPRDPENLIELENDIVDAIDAVIRGLKYHSYANIISSIKNYNQFAKAFGLKQFKGLGLHFDTTLPMLDHQNEKRREKLEKTRDEREAIKNAGLRIKAQNEIKRWLNHETFGFPQSMNRFLDFDYCRIKKSHSDVLETQRGAEVPLVHAKTILDFVDKGLGIQNQSIGHFRIDSGVDEKGNVKIGCHMINVEQVRKALGSL